MFEGRFYDQVDGMAVGSPLGPVFANLFMGIISRDIYNHLKNVK